MWLNNRGKEATISRKASLKKQNLYPKVQNQKMCKNSDMQNVKIQ